MACNEIKLIELKVLNPLSIDCKMSYTIINGRSMLQYSAE